MALRIDDSNFVTRRQLLIQPKGVFFQETAFTGGSHRFTFAQIECLLLSPSGLLSFQVGQEVFKIQTKPGHTKHQEAIDALLAGLRESAPA
jgi:hypothetical protein